MHSILCSQILACSYHQVMASTSIGADIFISSHHRDSLSLILSVIYRQSSFNILTFLVCMSFCSLYMSKMMDFTHFLLYRNTNLCTTKLLCYTRSSPLLQQLPKYFNHSDQVVHLVKQFVFEDTKKLVLYKLTAVQSQSRMQELLHSFIITHTQQVIVLLVNRKEITKDIINHLRIMIEEAEAQAPQGSYKLFVLILYFPPAMFFDACYPALFLQGWNHCYMDTIGQSPDLGSGIVDIQEWFQQCCFEKSQCCFYSNS